MTKAQTIRLVGPTQRDHAIQQIKAANVGDVVTIGPETRSKEQNDKMWVLIKDLQYCLPFLRPFTRDEVKAKLMDLAFDECKMLPKLDGSGEFPYNHRSSLLNKKQFRDLIEIIYMYGARHDVQWSEKSQSLIDEWRG